MVYGYLRGGGISHDLTSSTTLLGRDPTCDIAFASRSVSGRHASIEFGPDGALLRDLNSRNGTFVNDTRVQNASIPLAHGDILRFGYEVASFRFELDEEPVASDNPPAQHSEERVLPPRALKRDNMARPSSRSGSRSPHRDNAGHMSSILPEAVSQQPPQVLEFNQESSSMRRRPQIQAGQPGSTGVRYGEPPQVIAPPYPGAVQFSAADSSSSVRLEEHLRARGDRQEVALARIETEQRMRMEQDLNELRRKVAAEEAVQRQKNATESDRDRLTELHQRINDLEAQLAKPRSPSVEEITQKVEQTAADAIWKSIPELKSTIETLQESIRRIESDLELDSSTSRKGKMAEEPESDLRGSSAITNAETALRESVSKLRAASDTLQTLREKIIERENSRPVPPPQLDESSQWESDERLRQAIEDERERTRAAEARATTIEFYARDLQQQIVSLGRRLSDRDERIEELSQPGWARTMQQQQSAIDQLQEQLSIKSEEVAHLQDAFGKIVASAQGSSVALAENFHGAFVKTTAALHAARAQLASSQQNLGLPARKWSELVEENKLLQQRLKAAESAAASNAQKFAHSLQQRDARIATINSHLAQVASGGTSKQEAAEFLVEQLRSQEESLAGERRRMGQIEAEIVSLRSENQYLHNNLKRLQSSEVAETINHLRDELEELRSSGCAEETLRLKDAISSLTERATKERTRAKRLYVELKKARSGAIDTDSALEVVSKLLQERDQHISQLESVQSQTTATTHTAEQRARAAEMQQQRASSELDALKRRHTKVVQMMKSSRSQHIPEAFLKPSTSSISDPVAPPRRRWDPHARPVVPASVLDNDTESESGAFDAHDNLDDSFNSDMSLPNFGGTRPPVSARSDFGTGAPRTQPIQPPVNMGAQAGFTASGFGMNTGTQPLPPLSRAGGNPPPPRNDFGPASQLYGSE